MCTQAARQGVVEKFRPTFGGHSLRFGDGRANNRGGTSSDHRSQFLHDQIKGIRASIIVRLAELWWPRGDG
jgi:hypothetical protein